MMDGSSLFPGGFHPSVQGLGPSGDCLAFPIRRIFAQPVKYIFIDFGLSYKHDKASAEPPLTSGFFGLEYEAPELQTARPYDPFILDLYILGMVYEREFLTASN